MEILIRFITEYGILIVSFLLTTISLILHFKKTGNTSSIRKIINNLMSIVEYTGLKGSEKKEVVERIFNDLKVGKIDNLSDYIDDTITLANNINVKQSTINEVINEERENDKMTLELELENDKLHTIILEKDTEITRLKEEIATLKRTTVTAEELTTALKVREQQILTLRKQLNLYRSTNNEVGNVIE